MPTKILRIAIWANGAVSVLLPLTLLVAWILIFNAPHSQPLFMVASIIFALCVTAIPILGVCMVVMEILSRRKRKPTYSGRVSGGRSHTEDST